MQILLPQSTAERRARAHRKEDDATWSLCRLHTAANFDVASDVPETWQLLHNDHRIMCGLCNDILRRRASKHEREEREAKAKLGRPPRITKAQREQAAWEKWHAAAHEWEKKL